MGRQRIQAEPLTNAQKQARHRAKQKAIMESLQTMAKDHPDTAGDAHTDINMNEIRESIKEELKTSWEPELKAERIAAERKKGRESAKKADKNFNHGYISGICNTAAYFISNDRVDIAQSILSHYMITRDTAIEALQADKRIKSLILERLDMAGAWDKPPAFIR